jgi:hypothetical protein
MFPNWTGWKTIKLVLAIIAGAASGVAAGHVSDAITSASNMIGTIDGVLLSLVVVLSGTSMGPAVVGRAALKVLPLALVGALGFSASACLSAAQVKSLTDASGGLCQVVVQASDPALVPLCVPAQMLAEAIESLVGQTADGGVGAAAPSQDAIYAWCKAHGAKPVAQ